MAVNNQWSQAKDLETNKKRMKKLIYVLPLAFTMMACGEGSSADDLSLDSNSGIEDIDNAVHSFADGEASTAQQYFSGLVAEVVKVDVKFREVEALDEIDASEDKFNAVLDSAIVLIADGRKALDLYADKTWPKRAEFHDLTLEWFAAIEGMINDYLYDLAGPMSRADETWTDEELDFYTEYTEAYEDYYEVDARWVDFQYEFAAANNFELGGTIDEEAMVNEEVSHME